MLTVETDGSEEASMTKNNEVQEERKHNVESREKDGLKRDEKHGEQEKMVYEEVEVRDGMHVNRSW